MLIELSISNLAVVSKSQCEFKPGLSMVTGETGAGKSMLVDALSWIMGTRASLDMIREGEPHAEISALFDITTRKEAKAWLIEQDLAEGNDCLIRRIVARDGRSRVYVNGRPVTVQVLKTLSEFLLNIHSQHQHLAMLKPDYQLELLDGFGLHDTLLDEIKNAYQIWRKTTDDLHAILEAEKASTEKHALLSYQFEELSALNLTADEWKNLNTQQKIHSHASAHASLIEEALAGLDNEEAGIIRKLHILHQKIIDAEKMNVHFSTVQTLFSQALVLLEEARGELDHMSHTSELDPAALFEIEKRLSQLFDVSRKHKVRPDDLYAHYEALKTNLNELELFHVKKEAAEENLLKAKIVYEKLAEKLTQARQIAAKKLSQAVNEMLPTVALQHAEFEISITSKSGEPLINGWDSIEFLIATGPQQSKAPLAKVVSGGELSRISLIIQVLTKGQKRPPCLVFDEVDTGISGHTASVVGKLLQKLATHTQIICITHLPQVAALGDHHYLVSKEILKDKVESKIILLDEMGRLEALASLLGGLSSKEAALSHAKALREEALI